MTTAANWLVNGTTTPNVAFVDGDRPDFGDGGSYSPAVAIAGTSQPGRMTFSNTTAKPLTLGGVALFTADWFKLVDETKAASGGKLLPALPGEKVSDKGDQLCAFWQDAEGYFELCLNGTIYDEVPDFEDEDAEEFDDSEFEQDEEETDEEFEERVQEARDEWESEQSSDRESRREEHELDWYRQSCPGAQAVPYLQGLFSELEANSEAVDAGVRPGPRMFVSGYLMEWQRVYYKMAVAVSSNALIHFDFIMTAP